MHWRHLEQWLRQGGRVLLVNEAAAVRRLHYACLQSPVGPFWVFWAAGVVCMAGFTEDPARVHAGRQRPMAWIREPCVPAALVDSQGRVRVAVTGTPFQERVWRALARVAPGNTCSYQALARAAGSPRAARAVGNAVAANPIALFLPCHRVVRSDGSLGGYHWGGAVKAGLLRWERGLR